VNGEVTWVLDTNVIIHDLRGDPALRRRLAAHQPQSLAVTAITMAELEYGSLRSTAPERHRQRWQYAISNYQTLPFLPTAAAHHARVRMQLRQHPIGERDLIIAAIALAHGCGVVTHNRSEYERVPGLRVEDWTG
jgi:tRNA(fMet)-specific endonuclease VapC